MGSWWIVVACCLVAVALHILVNIKGDWWLAGGNVVIHLAMLITQLLLEITLQQIFVFLLISVTANMVARSIVLKVRQKHVEGEVNPSSQEI